MTKIMEISSLEAHGGSCCQEAQDGCSHNVLQETKTGVRNQAAVSQSFQSGHSPVGGSSYATAGDAKRKPNVASAGLATWNKLIGGGVRFGDVCVFQAPDVAGKDALISQLRRKNGELELQTRTACFDRSPSVLRRRDRIAYEQEHFYLLSKHASALQAMRDAPSFLDLLSDFGAKSSDLDTRQTMFHKNVSEWDLTKILVRESVGRIEQRLREEQKAGRDVKVLIVDFVALLRHNIPVRGRPSVEDVFAQCKELAAKWQLAIGLIVQDDTDQNRESKLGLPSTQLTWRLFTLADVWMGLGYDGPQTNSNTVTIYYAQGRSIKSVIGARADLEHHLFYDPWEPLPDPAKHSTAISA